MDAVRLARFTTALTLAGGGLAAGHLVLPHGAALSRRAAFWGLMIALGAFRGWRESAVARESQRRATTRIVGYGAAAALLAYLANLVVHG
jgi:hypothetical protein